MRNLIYLIFLTVILSCGFKPLYNPLMGDIMKFTMDGTYSKEQLDSMCVTDSLPLNLGLWDSIASRDYEDESVVTIHYLYSSTDSTDILYKIEKIGYGRYKIIKRETGK